MSKSPKLKVKWCFGFPKEETIYDLEEAKSLLPFDPHLATSVVVEGQWVSSYENLIALIAQETYKDREFLDVMLVPYIAGG